MKHFLTIFCIMVLNALSFGQCMLMETSISDMTKYSDEIVEIEVLKNFCSWDPNNKRIYTIHELKVYGSFKNKLPQKIYIVTIGGKIGNTMHIADPELKLTPGDFGILFMKSTEDFNFLNLAKPVFKASFNAQSFFKYNVFSNEVNGIFKTYDRATKDLDREIETYTSKPYQKNETLLLDLKEETASNSRMITSFSPTTITAGTKSVLTINGSGFGSTPGTVSFRYASANAGHIPAASFEILTWSNTQITVEVPDDAGTGVIIVTPSGGSDFTSTSTLNIPSAQTLVYESNASKKTRHSVTAADNSKINYTLNTNFNNNTPAKESFLRAMKTWRCENSVNWGIASNTSNISTNANDDVNIIAFGSLGGPLGVAYSYYNGCSQGGGPTVWHLTEMDIIFETAINWNFSTNNPSGSQSDFESVALHELGHTLCLGHIIDNTKVMHRSIPNGQTRRTPSADEINAVADVMTRSTVSIPPMCGFFRLNYAPNVIVTNNSDAGAGSLRQALEDVCENDTITMNIAANSTITLTSAELAVNKSVKIHGLGQSTFTLSGNNARRIFNVQAGKTLSIQNMKLINATSATNGGAIYNNGILNLKNITFQNNFQNGVRKAFTSTGSTSVNAENSVIINN